MPLSASERDRASDELLKAFVRLRQNRDGTLVCPVDDITSDLLALGYHRDLIQEVVRDHSPSGRNFVVAEMEMSKVNEDLTSRFLEVREFAGKCYTCSVATLIAELAARSNGKLAIAVALDEARNLRLSPTAEMAVTSREVEDVYPDLARLVLAMGRTQEACHICKVSILLPPLMDLGHRRLAIAVALQREGDSDSWPIDEITLSKQTISDFSSIALALSGGGLRATLFELGILVYLRLAKEMEHVGAIVSVSGGSILAAHFLKNWTEATKSLSGFSRVAARLIELTQCDIRNSAMRAWIWWRLPIVTHFMSRFSRIAFLEVQYKRLFRDMTLGNLQADGTPHFAFVATDIDRRRVAFTPSGILRLKLDGTEIGEPIFSRPVHVSLAVAASSCFPPVFETLRLTHKEIGVTYDEFPDKLKLTDGGVVDNLGVEMLCALLDSKRMAAATVLVCDAEGGLVKEPSGTPLDCMYVALDALSSAARTRVRALGAHAKLIQLRLRALSELDLSDRAVTKIVGYRTDLDRPSWEECAALIIHGAAVCEYALSSKAVIARPSPSRVRKMIQGILCRAGAPSIVPEPDEKALSGCDQRSYGVLYVHAFLAVITLLLVMCLACEAVSGVFTSVSVHPIKKAWFWFAPEKVLDMDAEAAARRAAAATCNGTLKKDGIGLELENLYRAEVPVAGDSTASVIYSQWAIQPPKCEREIQVTFVFRKAEQDYRKLDEVVEVTGRLVDVKPTPLGGSVWVEFEECTVGPPSSFRSFRVPILAIGAIVVFYAYRVLKRHR